MAVYRVEAESTDYLYVDIEANSPQEAYEYADKYVDGSEFKPNGSSWQMSINMVSELPEGSEADYNANED